MLIRTKCFGEIDLEDSKIIHFDNGIMGFEDCKDYTILYDIEEGDSGNISWLQSVDEPGLALPVINPLYVMKEYDPVVEDEIIKSLGELNDDNLVILVTLTVPSDITKMTANLKAPLVMNADTRKGCQIIVEEASYKVKYNVYDAIQKLKEEKGVD